MKFTKYIAASMIALAGFTSCSESFLDTDYTQYLDQEAAGEAAGKNPDVFLNGMWSWMVTFNQTNNSAHDDFGYMGSLHATDMMAEDVVMASSHWFNYDHQLDNHQEPYRRTLCHWLNYYTMIAKSNEIISLYPNGGETVDQKGLIGQAQAIRGLAYLHLIQLYQFASNADGSVNASAPGVPLVLTTADGKTEEELATLLGRNTVGEVMAQIELDLTNAVTNLEAGYERPSKNYVDASVANGILARYYLLANKWQDAANAANKARQGYPIMKADANGLYDGFVTTGNSEWMWGFAHTTETQTTYASFFSMISNIAPGYAGIGYAPRLIDARLYSQIPDTDARKAWFNGPEGAKQATAAASLPYANVKFGVPNDDMVNQVADGDWTLMRYEEMILVQAEGLARSNQEAAAKALLEGWVKANRDANYTCRASDEAGLVDEIWMQRRIELWGEGFAWFDLNRLEKPIIRTTSSNWPEAWIVDVDAHHDCRIWTLPDREIQNNDGIDESDNNPVGDPF